MAIQRQQVGESDEDYLKKALAYCRKEYKRRRETEYCHNSHTASDVMLEAQRLFPDLGTFGVEGFCDDVGNHGVSYLNSGDTYAQTIIFRSNSGRFYLGDWGSIVEAAPEGRYR
jgi:hypothetical protein